MKKHQLIPVVALLFSYMACGQKADQKKHNTQNIKIWIYQPLQILL